MEKTQGIHRIFLLTLNVSVFKCENIKLSLGV